MMEILYSIKKAGSGIMILCFDKDIAKPVGI
jgi:hypothetical protein